MQQNCSIYVYLVDACKMVLIDKFHLTFFTSLLLARTATAVVLDTPGGVVTEGSWALYSCIFPCTHSIVAWRVGEDLVIDNTRLSLQGFDTRLQQSGITEASIDMISSCSDSTETGTKRLRIRVTTQLDGTPIQCEALPRDANPGSTNLYSLFSILHVQPQATTDGVMFASSTAPTHPTPTHSSSSTCVCTPSYTTSTITGGTAPSVSITPSPALCPSPTPEIHFITRVVTKRMYVGPSAERPPLTEPTQSPRSSTSGVSRICNSRHLKSVTVALVIVVVADLLL